MIRNPFRRRPPAELPEALASLIDGLATSYTRSPGQVMASFEAHSDALFAEESVAFDRYSTPAERQAAADRVAASRADVLALCPTVRGAVRRGISATTEPRKEATP